MGNYVNDNLLGTSPYKSQQDEAKKLVHKWDKTGLLDGLNEDFQKSGMAVMLENQAKQLINENSATGGGAGGNASNTVNGTPGAGLPFSITGTSKTYSEGGAGGYHNAAGDSNPGQGGRGASGDGGGTEERNATAGAFDGVVYIAYKGPQRGTGGTIDTTSRPGYTIHKFTRPGPDLFVG